MLTTGIAILLAATPSVCAYSMLMLKPMRRLVVINGLELIDIVLVVQYLVLVVLVAIVAMVMERSIGKKMMRMMLKMLLRIAVQFN